MSDEFMYTVDALPFDVLSDLEPLQPDAIALNPEQIDAALALSQRSPQTETQWQIYLTALALNGFEQWLHDRTNDLIAQQNHCTILSTPFADATTAACNLQVNGFRLCIIGLESVFDETIAIPAAAIDSPDYVAHFYVPIEVYEEQAHIRLCGFLRYDQLRQHQATALELAEDSTYRLPLDWFESDPNRLLLHLSCLDPSALALPAIATTSLQRAMVPVHWQQILVQPALDLGRWLRQQWHETTEALSWHLLPPLEPAGAMRGVQSDGMRSPTAAFATLLTTLERQGQLISPDQQGMYRDWIFANHPLRLYVATNPIVLEGETSEWSLLMILTTSNQTNLPPGIRLQVSDGNTLIGEQVLSGTAPADYLYLTAIGGSEEQFIVTIALADGTAITLPPFRYTLDVSHPNT